MNSFNDHQETSPRSPLHTSKEIAQIRHQNKVKKQYLLFPEQIKQEQEIQKIFQNFDRNNSQNLDINEMYDMFQKYGFNLTEEQLLEFFNVVDKDKNKALNWNEFKNSVVDNQASKIFYKIIKQVREQEQNESQSNFGYIPFNFNEMISYLNYLSSRDELQQSIQQSQQTTFEKFQKYLALLELNKIQIQNYKNYKLNNLNQDEKYNQTQKEIDFTKIYQNKYQSSKSSYLNGKDFPILQQFKSEKRQIRNSQLKLNKSIESSKNTLYKSISNQPIQKLSMHLSQSKQENKILNLKKSQIFNFNQSPTNQKRSHQTPYLNLDFNKINQNYRDNLFNQSQIEVNQKCSKSPDRLPPSILQELQKFQILSGQYNKEKYLSDLETRSNNLKSKCSILRTSTEVSPTNSKLCSPKQQIEEKYSYMKNSPNRKIKQNYSQYNQKEKKLDITLKGKSMFFK